MLAGARRLLSRRCCLFARRALLVLCLWPTMAVTQDTIVSARFADPTSRYAHGVLGDAIEYGTLVLTLQSGVESRIVLPKTSVFEDTAPRLADVDADGFPEVIVVESEQAQGARLSIYSTQGLVVATPYIGTRFRWLAPLGVADLDGDNAMEIAYVDRPHLAKTLRIWRFTAGRLVEVAVHAGVTNHQIGETDIAGGIRDCGTGPEMILADTGWRSLLSLRFDGKTVHAREIGDDTSRASFDKAMACQGS